MIRLTGGELNGRAVETPKHHKTRPTQARLRQALFNSIQFQIPEAQVLDLFSGSGSLAFEALSRGARLAVAVESDAATAKIILKNAEALGVKDLIRVQVSEVQKFFEQDQALVQKLGVSLPFDLVFADPPYAAGFEVGLLEKGRWRDWLKEDGVLCLEWSPLKSKLAELPERVPFLVKIREKNYGDSVLTTYRRTAESDG